MVSRIGWQGFATGLAAIVLVVVLLYAPAADTAPGDLADLAVSKSDNPDPVLVGSTLTYTIQVTNLGPQNATGVTVTDRLPKHVDFVSATTSSGTCDRRGSRVTCDVGALAADPTKANAVTVTIQVRPTRVGTIKNTASVESVENDPIGVNDRAETSTTVTAPPLASSCRGIQATVTGTRGSDRLVGTSAPDVIAGLGGGDAIVGLAGRDLICAGRGNDRVTAGSAADRVFGGAGADRLLGRGGPDLLAGNPGRDVLTGNQGNDRLRGGRGFDRCFGGAGRDIARSCVEG
jgi:uncharacterized repeat protein (TIGR01451 family)